MKSLIETSAAGRRTVSRRNALRGLLAAGIAPAALLTRPSSVCAGEGVGILAASYPAFLAVRTATRGIAEVRSDLLVNAQTGCPHDYAMTPQDRMKLEACDVLILNGRGYESFLDERLLQSLPGTVVDAGSGLPTLAASEVLFSDKGHGHSHDDENPHKGHGHSHGDENPHYFANPACFAQMVGNIAQVLSKKYPQFSVELNANARRARDRAAELTAALRAVEAGLGGKKVHLVLQHDTLAWFFVDTNFTIAAVLLTGEGEAPSPALLLDLAGRMKDNEFFWLLVGEPQFPSDVLDVLARESGAPEIFLDPLASGPADPAGDHYFKVMEKNLAELGKVLESQEK